MNTPFMELKTFKNLSFQFILHKIKNHFNILMYKMLPFIIIYKNKPRFNFDFSVSLLLFIHSHSQNTRMLKFELWDEKHCAFVKDKKNETYNFPLIKYLALFEHNLLMLNNKKKVEAVK